MIPNSGKLSPLKLHWNLLNNAVNLTTKKLIRNEWSDKTAQMFLTRYGINNNGFNNIIRHVKSMKAIHILETLYKLSQDILKVPQKYEGWKGSPYWKSRIEMHYFVDAGMHQLFLGITKACNDLISDWLQVTKQVKGTFTKNGIFL